MILKRLIILNFYINDVLILDYYIKKKTEVQIVVLRVVIMLKKRVVIMNSAVTALVLMCMEFW